MKVMTNEVKAQKDKLFTMQSYEPYGLRHRQA